MECRAVPGWATANNAGTRLFFRVMPDASDREREYLERRSVFARVVLRAIQSFYVSTRISRGERLV